MTEVDITIPPAVRMQQLLGGFAVSQALYVVAEAEWHDLLAGAGFRLDRVVSGSAMHSAIEATFTTD